MIPFRMIILAAKMVCLFARVRLCSPPEDTSETISDSSMIVNSKCQDQRSKRFSYFMSNDLCKMHTEANTDAISALPTGE